MSEDDKVQRTLGIRDDVSYEEKVQFERDLAGFLASSEGRTLNDSVNLQASMDVIEAVNLAPQDTGAEFIIADFLLHTLDGKPYTKRPYDERSTDAPAIGIKEMAQIAPDPAVCAWHINRLVALALQEFLMKPEHLAVRTAVAAKIESEADSVRESSHDRIQDAFRRVRFRGEQPVPRPKR